MSYTPYSDREFLLDCVKDVDGRLDQIIALLKQLVTEMANEKKDK